MDQEPTAAQMLGTVRSALKAYKDFEHLAKLVSFLEQKEAYEGRLQASVRNLEIEKADLEETIETHKKEIDALVGDVEKTQVFLDQIKSTAESTRQEIVGKAQKEADQVTQRAEQTVASIAASGDSLRAENATLEKEIFKKKSEIEDLKSQYQKERDRIIKALNG